MSFDEFSDSCPPVQDTDHMEITSPLHSLSEEEACSENILQKQITLVPSKNE